LSHSLVVGQDGRIYLCDRENRRIQVFCAEGEYITMWTDMQRPLDISQDLEGKLVISERVREDGGPAQMSVLDGEGNVLARWLSRLAYDSWGGRPRRHILGSYIGEKYRQIRSPNLASQTLKSSFRSTLGESQVISSELVMRPLMQRVLSRQEILKT